MTQNEASGRSMAKLVPLPNGKDISGQTTPPRLVGMLHVPVSNILSCRTGRLRDWDLPIPTVGDNAVWRVVSQLFSECDSEMDIPDFKRDYRGVIALSDQLPELEELVEDLSFIGYLRERTLREIEVYLKNGVQAFQLENVGAPYSANAEIPVVEQLVMNDIAATVRKVHPELPVGIQILSFGESIALEIAVRHRLFYVRGESFMFPGTRADCRCPTNGALKKAYAMRGYFNRELGYPNEHPRMYADLRKKHTVFPPEFQKLETWLDSLSFMKIEGIILTGQATGKPIAEADLVKARVFLDRWADEAEVASRREPIPLIAGSGANSDNIAMYRKYCNAIIVGSSVKQKGNWELELDEERVKRLTNDVAT